MPLVLDIGTGATMASDTGYTGEGDVPVNVQVGLSCGRLLTLAVTLRRIASSQPCLTELGLALCRAAHMLITRLNERLPMDELAFDLLHRVSDEPSQWPDASPAPMVLEMVPFRVVSEDESNLQSGGCCRLVSDLLQDQPVRIHSHRRHHLFDVRPPRGLRVTAS